MLEGWDEDTGAVRSEGRDALCVSPFARGEKRGLTFSLQGGICGPGLVLGTNRWRETELLTVLTAIVVGAVLLFDLVAYCLGAYALVGGKVFDLYLKWTGRYSARYGKVVNGLNRLNGLTVAGAVVLALILVPLELSRLVNAAVTNSVGEFWGPVAALGFLTALSPMALLIWGRRKKKSRAKLERIPIVEAKAESKP